MQATADLDRSSIRRKVEVAALRVEPKMTGEVLRRLRAQLLNLARVRNVETDPNDSNKKVVLLSRELPLQDTAGALPNDIKQWIATHVEAGCIEFVVSSVDLGYEYFTAEEILRMVLPAHVDVPTSFEMAGHVVHLNLRADQLPYKRVIGQVILDKLAPRVRTVVNKIGDVASTYRTFPLEVIAGVDDTKVVVKEDDCEFAFDLREVYWNSRLQTEHSRLANALVDLEPSNDRQVVADATCGVGPFAIPLALDGRMIVHANDLNPAAIDALKENARRNKCPTQSLRIYDPQCARLFLRRGLARIAYDHVITNLPASGIDMLDAFRGIQYDTPPLIHCYCFAGVKRSEAVVSDILGRVGSALGTPPPPAAHSTPLASPDIHTALRAAHSDNKTSVRWIRNVAPNKDMYCVCFRVPAACSRLAYDDTRHGPGPLDDSRGGGQGHAADGDCHTPGRHESQPPELAGIKRQRVEAAVQLAARDSRMSS